MTRALMQAHFDCRSALKRLVGYDADGVERRVGPRHRRAVMTELGNVIRLHGTK